MNYISLYRKYRPRSFDKIIGQEHITTALKNQIKSGNIGHAYLFTGTRGIGKTSIAKIFARAVNCLSPEDGSPCGKCAVCKALSDDTNIDIIEADAASNNSVNDVRDIIGNIQYPPTIGKYRIYILDEAHMMSNAAFNALLKSLEEPPSYMIFILATTEAQKLPQTILSRCMRFDFRLVPIDALEKHVASVLEKEGKKYDKEAVRLIASKGEGSVRDALSLADMCLAYSPDYISYRDALKVLGVAGFSTLYSLSAAVLAGSTRDVLKISAEIYDAGRDITTVSREFAAFLRDLLQIKNINGYRADFTDDEYAAAKDLAGTTDNYRLMRALEIASGIEGLLRYSSEQRIIFEASLVKAAEMRTDLSIEGLLSRIDAVEKGTGYGARDTGADNSNIDPQLSPLPSPLSSPEPPKPITEISEQNILDYAVPVSSEETPFGEAEEAPGDYFEAERIWGLALTTLREEGDRILYYALKSQKNIEIRGDKLVLTVSDMATSDLLARAENLETAAKIISGVSGGKLKFVVESAVKNIEKKNEDKVKLNELFGAKLIDKTKK
jgi:DNA polymerase III, subunit gamma and tau